MLTFDAVNFAYAGAPVLADIRFVVPPGRVLAVLGSSGCGKSTLLRLAGGLLRPSNGRVANGFARTATVFQEPRLLPWRRAGANIAFGLKAMGLPAAERRARVAPILARLGLSAQDAAKFPHELSGGMRQRVGVGRALAVDPDLLLLDEPFNALDFGLRRELQSLVRGLIDERGIAAAFVTHDIAEAIRMADDLVVLGGRPARIVHRHIVPEPFTERDDAFVFETAARFLREPAVGQALGR